MMANLGQQAGLRRGSHRKLESVGFPGSAAESQAGIIRAGTGSRLQCSTPGFFGNAESAKVLRLAARIRSAVPILKWGRPRRHMRRSLLLEPRRTVHSACTVQRPGVLSEARGRPDLFHSARGNSFRRPSAISEIS